MDTFIINTITHNDVKKKSIRVLTCNKHFFPIEKQGKPEVYNILIQFNNKKVITTYKIGSKDGKSRSGIIKNNFFDTLKPSQNLKFERTGTLKFKVEII